MTMRLTRTFAGLGVAAFGAAIFAVAVHFTARAAESIPTFCIDSTPANRDAAKGTSFAGVVKKTAPSVVNIYTARFVKERPNPFFNDPIFRQFFGNQFAGDDRERTRKEQSLGSGVIVSSNGYIVTANHVVAGADQIKISIAGNKTESNARLIGRDELTDVAVLKIDGEHFPAATLADSDQLEVGDVVLAIGNPFGVGQTVTKGIVSALGRSVGFNGYQNFIQTDAAINPGNSGGALIDAQGRLVGINTAIISGSGGNQGIGFAVPVNMARRVLQQLITTGKIRHGYLDGVSLQDIDGNLAKEFALPDENGVLIGDVAADSAAGKAGLKSGDVITAVNGRVVADVNSLQLIVSGCEPGSPAALKIFRDASIKIIPVTLGELVTSSAVDAQKNSDTVTTTAFKTDALDGVTVADFERTVRVQLRLPDDVQGAIVTQLDRDSNAADAGLKPTDIITEINHQPVKNSADAVRLCKAAKSDQILLKIWRPALAGTRFLSVDNAKRPK